MWYMYNYVLCAQYIELHVHVHVCSCFYHLFIVLSLVRVAAELSGNDKPSKSVPKASGTTPTQTGPSHSYPSSDAVLNCPACMTTLCLDCQR